MKGLYVSLILLLLTACSGVKPYPDLPNKNFAVKTETDSGSTFSKVQASLDIYGVNADCSTIYKGTIHLDKPVVEFALPPKQQSYLVFAFNRSGFFSGESSASSNTLLTPRAGYRYLAEVSYIKDVYNAVIYEMNPGGKKSRELEFKELDTCKGNKDSSRQDGQDLR